MSVNKTSRRNFLKSGVTASVASLMFPYIVPSGVTGKTGRRRQPSDRVVIGAIGVGNRGNSLLSNFSEFEDVDIAAVADVDMNRCREIGNQFGAATYQDYRDLLDRDDIDGVVIASPDHWHALHAIHAAQAGKDIYCEKALSLTIREGRLMTDAARKYDRIFQTGTQQRSEPNFYRACMLIRNGYIGKVQKVIAVNYTGPWENALPAQPIPAGLDWDMWCGQVPVHPYHAEVKNNRGRPGWLSIRDFSGGEITGWGTHGVDQIHWALGTEESGPVEVWTEGIPYRPWIAVRDDRPGRFFGATDPIIHMRYPGNVHVEFSDYDRPRGGALFIGDKGKIRINRDTLELSNEEWRTVPLENMRVQLRTSDNHYHNWVECMKDRSRPIADVEIGHRSASACHLGNIVRWISQRSQQTGDRLIWDSKQEKFTNNDWGNFYLDRPRREQYGLPKDL